MEHELSYTSEIVALSAHMIETIRTEGYESATFLINEIKKRYRNSDTGTKQGLLNLVDNLVLEGGTNFHQALIQSEFLIVLSNTRVRGIINLVLGYLDRWKSQMSPSYMSAFDESIELLRDTFTGVSFGLTQLPGPGSMGQFQVCPVNPLIPFYTMLYFRAQRILSLGRSSFTFYMLNVHISRQALHLVILLNDLAYMEDGLNSEQMDERVDLEDELIELESKMRVWGFEAEGGDHIDKHLPEIREQYAQIFKERFYFAATRDPAKDKIFKKLLSYDRRPFSLREVPMDLDDPSMDVTDSLEVMETEHSALTVTYSYPHNYNSVVSTSGDGRINQEMGYPIRGVDNNTWVNDRFTHLPPESAALKRRQLRSFLATPAWHHNTRQRGGSELDYFVLRSSSTSFRCEFCKDVHTSGNAALQCVCRHLDYHPSRQ